MWRDLSRQHACQSPAMDKILDLVGLNNVKKEAVKIFELALQYSKMTPRQRSTNIGSFNYCFAGNPGTGKTTVAKLFAELLRDSGLRGTDTFVQCNAQKLKEDGPEEFRKLITNAMNGVLFIDEAYDLDPNADFKGKPIVAELLTAAEKHQDKLSIIIAGYENDINKKLYSYNDGLKNRFQTIIFEDFDENELSEIWRREIKRRGWTSDEKVDRIATNRLLRDSKRKGFCNAHAVRNLADLAFQQTLSRADFNQTMMLETSDIIGIHPLKNPEIQALLTEVNGMIGWAKFKKEFGELIKLCGQSYDRELNGKPPLPISLNRMFLGPPGVGKTTAAKFYSRLLKHLNYLSDGQVLEKKADEFVGQKFEETQEKTLVSLCCLLLVTTYVQ
ncbi:P-loop containing nucleoside triphosphate hydrolase protein, partial [Paraphysoderma sedebokerense]